MSAESRNFAEVLERVDAAVPPDHAVRAEGWDSAVKALNASYVYSAPEIVGNMWVKLGGACAMYFTKYAELGEEWALHASAILRNTDDKGCCCCHSPSKEELDAMIKAHPERLVLTPAVRDAAEALLMLSKEPVKGTLDVVHGTLDAVHGALDTDVVHGAQALLQLRARPLK